MQRLRRRIYAVVLVLAMIGADASHGASAPTGNAPLLVELAPMTVGIFTGDGPGRRITIVIMLEMEPGAPVPERGAHVRLRDVMLKVTYAIGETELRRAALLSVPEIRSRLLKASRQVLGREAVRNVLIQSLVRGQ